MLHIYKTPPIGAWDGTPQSVPIYSAPHPALLAARLVAKSQSHGEGVAGEVEDRARKGGNRRKHAELDGGTFSPETRGASAQRRQRCGQADTFRDASNK